jgi:hypothetical protein
MLKRISARILFGLAAVTALAWWNGRRSGRAQPAFREVLEATRLRHLRSQVGADLYLDDNALADRSSADSFPASDPPSRMGSLIARPPFRHE